MEETVLIRKARQGDLDAFNQLVLLYQRRVYNQAYRILGEVGAAEDATQEAFISAFRKLHTFRGGSFLAWLLRIVSNACYDELRRRARRSVVPLDGGRTAEESDEDASPWMASPDDTPEQALQRAELRRAIQDCISRLPFDFRVVLVLVDVQGLDYRTAAQVIARPVGTVRSRLARARSRVQDCLSAVWELLPSSLRPEEEVSL